MAKALVNSQGKAYVGSNSKVLTAPSGYGSYDEFPSYQVVNGVASRRRKTLNGSEFSNITSVADYGLYYAFYNHPGLVGNLNLSSITSIGQYGLYEAFSSCSGIESVNLSSLTSISNTGLGYAFQSCSYITDIYFNSLTTTSFGSYSNQFYSMMDGTGRATIHTLHFPSNLESIISTLSGYPLFGGRSGYVVCVLIFLQHLN
jgi:hypothetical protein